MDEIAPGSILQRMYFKNRLKKMKAGKFLEVGCGNGYLSEILLSRGWQGTSFDLGESACEKSRQRNAKFITEKKYSVVSGDFLTAEINEKSDLVISMMVIEHLAPENVERYFEKCKKIIKPEGKIAVFVPAGMKHWGVEDDIAGHFRRYEFADFYKLAEESGLVILDLSGLTYPVSNLLLGLSNRMVRKNEGHKKDLSLEERTIQSGDRSVKFKTSFPFYLKLLLNEMVLFPFHLLQIINKKNPGSMVIYCEMGLRK